MLREALAMAHDVFISHSAQDKPVADTVCAALEAAHLRCWIAPRDIVPGQDWPEAIVEAIAASRVMVLVFSSHADQSQQITREVERAVAKGVSVIPFRIEDVVPTRSLEYLIGPLHWLNAITPPLERHLGELVEAVRLVLSKAEPAGPSRRVEVNVLETKLRAFTDRLRFRNVVVIGSIAIALGASAFAVTSILDALTLDTRIETYTMWLGNLIFAKGVSPHLALVSTAPDADRSRQRQRHAQLIDVLAHAGAKVVAFDMFFESGSPADPDLQAAMMRARQRGTAVVVGVNAMSNGQPALVGPLREAVGDGWGALCVGNKLGYAWVEPLAIDRERPSSTSKGPPQVFVWSLALSAVAAFRDLDLGIDQVDEGRREILADHRPTHDKASFGFSLTRRVRRVPKGCPLIREGDRVHSLLIDLSPLATLRASDRRFAYESLLGSSDAGRLARFRNAIVVVGVEAPSDSFRVGPSGEHRFGFELHADAVNTLLGGVTIRSLGALGQVAITVVMAILGGATAYVRPRAPRHWRRWALALILIAYLAGTVYAYGQFHVLVNTLYHAGALVGAYALAGRVQRRWFPSAMGA